LREISIVLSEFWAGLNSVIASAGPADLLDILVISFLLYHAIRLVRETRAIQLVKGIGAILFLYFAASNLNMITLTTFITNIVQFGVVALAIVFQPELRRALEQVGRSRISRIGRLGGRDGEELTLALQTMIAAVAGSVTDLSRTKTGALMVIERETKLGDVTPSGTLIDADASVALICNIFYPNTPMHDGAMIFREGRVHAAGCFLPLSANDEIGRELGTRHRAALGMSEVSDAIVIVVSEETGAISVCINGKLDRGRSVEELIEILEDGLIGQKGDESKKTFWRKSQ